MLNTFTALARINYHTFLCWIGVYKLIYFFIFDNVLNFQAESELESDSGISINLSHFDTDLASQVLFLSIMDQPFFRDYFIKLFQCFLKKINSYKNLNYYYY